MSRSLVLTACLLLFGCPGPSPAGPTAESPAEPTVAPPPTPPPGTPAPPVAVEGEWRSASCGERAFERRITFAEGTYAGQDLVSPCPPDVVCIWSGIVTFNGTWTADAGAVTLNEAKADPAGMAANHPRPAELLREGPHLVEVAGDARCVYGRP